MSYDPDQRVAVTRAKDQFRWFTGGWRVNAELPVPLSFDAATKTVREEDVSARMPCGPDVECHVAGIRQFEAAGITHIALVQVGGDGQEQFISWAATELMPPSAPNNRRLAALMAYEHRSGFRRQGTRMSSAPNHDFGELYG